MSFGKTCGFSGKSALFGRIPLVSLPQGEGDPVVEQPFVLEREDRQEKIFVDVFQGLADAATVRIQRPGNERLEL